MRLVSSRHRSCPCRRIRVRADGGVAGQDPFTPMLRAYANDRVQVRALAGAHMNEHSFLIHGVQVPLRALLYRLRLPDHAGHLALRAFRDGIPRPPQDGDPGRQFRRLPLRPERERSRPDQRRLGNSAPSTAPPMVWTIPSPGSVRPIRVRRLILSRWKATRLAPRRRP